MPKTKKRKNYPELLPLTIKSEELIGHNIPSEIMKELFTETTENEFEFKITDEKQLELFLIQQSIEEIKKIISKTIFQEPNKTKFQR